VIHVSGADAVSYKYSINHAPYSPEIPIGTPIDFGANVRIGDRTFLVGSKELYDFVNLRTDELSDTPFTDRITLSHVESQVQVAYLLNKIRAEVKPENILNLRGTGVESLAVELKERVAAGDRYELSALSITGGELWREANSGSTKAFRLSLSTNRPSITVTPTVNNNWTAITVNGSLVASNAAVVITRPVDNSVISIQTTGPDGPTTVYTLRITRDDTLSDTATYRGYYLRAFDPVSAYLSIHNVGGVAVSSEMVFNERFGLSRQELIREILAMAPEYPDETTPRKVWRFIRDNRYHFFPITNAGWLSSPSLFFNSAGFGLCGDSANVFYHLMTALGYTARVWRLGGHVVAEVLVNDRWEMWDPDLEVNYRNQSGMVAGVQELAANPGLITNPIDPIQRAFDLSAYSTNVAGIYSSTNDNSLQAGFYLDTLADAPPSFEIPPDGVFEFPDVYDAPLAAVRSNPGSLDDGTGNASYVPSYTNARLIVPAGFSGTISMPLIIQSIGLSNSPTLSVITKNTAGIWDSQPATVEWTVDVVSPITTASQPSGSYSADSLLTLTTNEPATIYYTTDGSTPTSSSAIYTSPFAIPVDNVVRFFAVDTVGNAERARVYGPPASGVDLNSSGSGGWVRFEATATGLSGSYEYMYVVGNSQNVWSTKRSYDADSSWVWDTTSEVPGVYSVQVWVRNAGSTAPFEAVGGLSVTIDPFPATAVTLLSNVQSPQTVATSVTLTAAASGGSGDYEYQFVLRNPSGAWSIVQPYGASDTWTWTAAGVGDYVLQVWARNAGSAAAYDTWTGMNFTVIPAPVSSVSVSASVPSPQVIGASIAFTAVAAGTSGSYEYQFVLRNPQGTWSTARGYNSSNSWIWNTAGLPAGTYVLQVWARNAGTVVSYDAWSGLTFSIAAAPASAVSLTSSVPSPQPSGTTVTFNATATGTAGSYEYQFVLMNPQGVWSVVRAYSSSSTWSWNTASLSAGTYVLQVWARNAGTTVSYDAWKGLSFSVSQTPVTAVTLTSNVPSPQTVGGNVTFIATAVGTSGSYEYQFVLKNPQGIWSVVRDYGSINSWTWDTAAAQPGSYMLQVWARNAGATVSYEAWKGLAFTLSVGP